MEEIPILGVIALRGGGNSYSRPRPRNFSFTARFVCYSGHRNRTAPFHANNTSELWLHLLWHRVLKLSRNLDRWSHAGLNRGPYGLAVRSNRLSYETHGRNPEGARNLRVALQLAALEIAQAKLGACHVRKQQHNVSSTESTSVVPFKVETRGNPVIDDHFSTGHELSWGV